MGRIECGSSLESLESEIEEAVRSFVFLLELVLFFFFFSFWSLRKDKICRGKEINLEKLFSFVSCI